ncbi:MAG TPA: hypothetical protein VN444_00315, partial [Verrucomicrobiae bacterium]|nr:hypothetical protein [Verrucomicrobiae bacterium]
MAAFPGARRIGQALLLAVVLPLAAVASVYAEQAPPEEAPPSWVNWLNTGLPFNFELTGLD